MGRNLFFTAFVIMVGLTFLAVSDRAESLDITQMMQGTVKEAKGNSLKIIKDSGQEAQIAIDSNTVYDNVQELTDLKAGNKVQVDYKIVHTKNIAVTVTKIESESDDSV